MALGLVTQPERLGGAASGGGGLADDAVQFLGYDPAGGDVRREWRVKDLNDFLTAGGGLKPVLQVFNFAFDTPGLKDGVLAFTLPVGSYHPETTQSVILVTEAWDGTTPQINEGFTQADAASGLITPSNITPDLDTDNGDGSWTTTNQNPVSLGDIHFYPATDPVEWWVGVDDGFGGDAGSTVGAARILLVYWPIF